MKRVGLEGEPLTCLREQRLLHSEWAVPYRGRHLPKDLAQLSFEVFAFPGLVLMKAEEETRSWAGADCQRIDRPPVGAQC